MTGIPAAFDWAFRATWQASCLAMLVLLVQGACGRRLSARARCWMWAVVIGRLMLPPLPLVRWTVLHTRAAAPGEVSRVHVDAPRVAAVRMPLLFMQPRRAPVEHLSIDPAMVAELRSELAAMREKGETAAVPSGLMSPPPVAKPAAALLPPPVKPPAAAPRPAMWPRLLRIIPWLWLAGTTWAIGRVLVASVRLWATVRRMPQHEDPATRELLASCAQQMGVGRRVPELRLADDLPGPALAGWLRPKLLVPPGVLAAFDPADLRLMFLHELAHVRRRDVAVNWLLSAATAVHWFNPLIHLCVRRLRADRELACDELVLASARGTEAAGPAYGHTLLRLADWLARAGATPAPRRVAGVVEILEDARELQRRIVMIARFNPATMKRWPALIAGGVLLMAGLALTDAAEPAAAKTTKTATTQPASRSERPPATQPAPAAAAKAPQPNGTVRLLEEKLAAMQAQLKARQEMQALVQKQFQAGIPNTTQETVARAAGDVAEVKMGVTDVEIVLAREGGPGDVAKLLARKVAEAEEVVQERQRSTALSKKRYEAALCDYTSVTEAQALEARAQAALVEAKLALDESSRRAGAGGERGAVSGPGATGVDRSQVMALKVDAARAKLAHAESELTRAQQLSKQAAISQSELERFQAAAAQARADVAEAELAAQDARPIAPVAGGASGPAEAARVAVDVNAAVQDPEAQRLDEETARKLLKPVQVTFRSGEKARPISDWAQDIAKSVGVNVIVQGRALEEAGIADDTPVRLSLQAPAPAAQVLTWALRDLGVSNIRVGYTIDHGAVVVSTADHLDQLAVTRVYDVSDLATPTGEGAQLPELLMAVIDPSSWMAHGGTVGNVLQFHDKLVVTQSQQNHADVARLLMLLRSKAAAGPGGVGPLAAPAARARPEGQPDDPNLLAEQFGPHHPRVITARRAAAAPVVEQMRQILIAVRLYDGEHERMPDGLKDPELAKMLSVRWDDNPRLPYLMDGRGFQWVGPAAHRLSDIKDPAHTALIREAAPQADGTELVGYADGHVAEVSAADEPKAAPAAAGAGAEQTVRFGQGQSMSVPAPIAAECQRIAEQYDKRRIFNDTAKPVNGDEVDREIREAINQRVDAWKKENVIRSY